MGRLTLNVLLSFAQFEREVTGERIRDKIAASKRKGMWMGGLVPLGYEVRARQLVVVEPEAETVRHIFGRYCELGRVRLLKAELDRDGFRSKPRVGRDGSRSGSQSFSRGAIYALLRNPIYVGEVRHKGTRYPGQHPAIVAKSMWEKAQELLHLHTVRTPGKPNGSLKSPLIGKLFDELGERLTPSHAVKGNRRYRYYVSRSLLNGGARNAHGWRIPALDIEQKLAIALATMLDDRTGIVHELDRNLDVANIQSVLETAAQWSARLRAEQDRANALASLIERCELAKGRIRLLVRVPPLAIQRDAHWVCRLRNSSNCANTWRSAGACSIKEIVAYYRGPYCMLSYEAVAELRKRGFKASRLEDRYPEWKAAGLPVEQSSNF
jgi:site-specific DNA recombinase